MKNKKIITVLLILLSLFIGINGAKAGMEINLGSTTGASSTRTTTKPAGQKCGVSFYFKYSPLSSSYYGVRVTILDGNANKSATPRVKTIDILNNMPGSDYRLSNYQYTKAEYLKKEITPSKSDFKRSATNGVYTWAQVGIKKEIPNFTTWTDNGTIEQWLVSNEHANIDAIFSKMGYKYEDINATFNDLIVIEPIFNYGNYIGTAYELLKSNIMTSSGSCSTNSSWYNEYQNDYIDAYKTCENCEIRDSKWKKVGCSLTTLKKFTAEGKTGGSLKAVLDPQNLISGLCDSFKNNFDVEACKAYFYGEYKSYKKCENDQTKELVESCKNPKNRSIASEPCANFEKSSARKACKSYHKNGTTYTPPSTKCDCEDPLPAAMEYASSAVKMNCDLQKYYGGRAVTLRRAATTVFTNTSYFGLTVKTPEFSTTSAASAVTMINGDTTAGVGIISIYDTFKKSGLKFDIKINKQSDNDDGVDGAVRGAKFTLTGNGTTATCTSNISGICSLTGLTEGTYTLTETVPEGYSTSDSKIKCEGSGKSSGYCSGNPSGKKWTIKLSYFKGDYDPTTRRVTINLTIYNTKTCKELFSQYSSTMATRVELYTKLKNTVGQDYRALLNMSNTTADSACKSVTVSRSINSGCMSFKSTANTFNKDNLSNFTELYSIGNKKFAYCSTELNITNSFRKDGVYEYTTEYQFNTQDSPIKSGQQLFPVRDETDGNIAKGVLTKTCFIYSQAPDGMSSLEDSSAKTEYDKYISVVKIDNKELNETVSVSGAPSATNDGSTYTKTYTAIYSIKPVYSEYGTGKLTTAKTDNARLLGQSIYSKFDDKIYNKTWIPLQNSVTYTNKVIKSIGSASKTTANLSNKCTYYVEQEIVDTCDPSKGMDCGGRNEDLLRIEYRTIDTKTPFPGESGTSARAVGANWCGTLARTGSNASISIPDCSNSNNIVEKYIKNSTNSYGRVESTSENKSPKYSFTLSATNIRQIRNYRWNNNKVYDYDDFASLTYDSAGKSSSSLLRSILGI